RTTLVAITPAGRELVEKATVVLNDVFSDIGMPDDESEALVGAIRSLRRFNGDF
ncbi:MarR family transcriptional regulator, partial [Tsukamurella pulmonis]